MAVGDMDVHFVSSCFVASSMALDDMDVTLVWQA